MLLKCIAGNLHGKKPKRKPWIQLGNVPNPEVWQAVEQCPSGALGVLYRHGVNVVFEPERCRSAAYDGDKLIGECDYQESESGWCIYHTEVDPAYGGKGIAKRLVYSILEAAERKGVSIVSTCSYASKAMSE
ncbi:MAG: GNAT family N-acetyltransferase [Lachnospiraceae bacterium]|nr:GNAT family N-acetyltransferase [Lachnospiraceae bacterium]